MNLEIVRKHSAPVPRYTSYPTAPNFSEAVGSRQYVDWLASLSSAARLSLYVHIPFCKELCWYCACSTKATRRYEPVAGYLSVLAEEISNVSRLVPSASKVTHIHWGGGSPSILIPDDIRRLSDALRENFDVARRVEFAVEIDPRSLPADSVRAFAGAGVTRASIGVQDFDPAVQAAINRVQSYESTRQAVDLFRTHGVKSINIDLVYGLPQQTLESVERTIGRIVSLRPDRIAVFGYAHVPSKARHQKLIDATSIPADVERYAQARTIADLVTAAGYHQIGIDHFALPTDELATRRLRRNFQGYTADDSDAIIGLGASAIGQLPQGYAQNAVPVGDYTRRVREIGVATVRGFARSLEDRMRAHVIERLMCDFSFSRSELQHRYGAAAQPLIEEAESLMAADTDGFVEKTADGFRCTETGRVLVRKICTHFDSYWRQGSPHHALAV